MEHGQGVRIPVAGVELEGDLTLPDTAVGGDASGIVAFAHGSGSSRHSPRNRFVADGLRRVGLATLLIDLLTPDEEARDQRSGELRFDIKLLADRLAHLVRWLWAQPGTEKLPIGLFGASTGGGAALVAAAGEPEAVGAVVSRGGRPDLARSALPSVRAPTLLIVGGLDTQVIELNRRAYNELQCQKRFEIVPGATHLFEEPGALERVTALAAGWFDQHFRI